VNGIREHLRIFKARKIYSQVLNPNLNVAPSFQYELMTRTDDSSGHRVDDQSNYTYYLRFVVNNNPNTYSFFIQVTYSRPAP